MGAMGCVSKWRIRDEVIYCRYGRVYWPVDGGRRRLCSVPGGSWGAYGKRLGMVSGGCLVRVL